jgi:DNA-binding CsgD family transcriptional regulator
MRIARRQSGPQLNGCGEIALSGALGDDLLAALFPSSTVGVAVCDRQLRFRAINDALASMNGVPAAAHLGKSIHSVLGRAAKKILPAYEHVFTTGQPIANFELNAKLPSRSTPGRWNESYFPIRDEAGEVLHVGVVVLELTRRQDIEASLHRLRDNLAMITSAIRNANTASPVGNDFLMRSVRLLEICTSEAQAISQLLSAAPLLRAVHTFDASGHAGAHLSASAPRQGSMGMEPQEASDSLSAREREVVAFLANGKTNKQIASDLAISIRTVESHRARIMLKLDLHSLSDLVRYALRNKLIYP